MSTTRQFLVSMSVISGEDFPADKMANRIAGRIIADTSSAYFGMVEREMMVIPLPDLDADDSALQIGFRKLAAFARSTASGETIGVFRTEAAALVAELSKEKPGRTSHVDHAALNAAKAIREVVSNRALKDVQKTARIQLIITDAICRCLPEVHS